VHDEAHVRSIDPHAERDRRHDDLDILIQECVLVPMPRGVVQPRMVGHRADAALGQPLRQRVHFPPRLAIDDARLAAMKFEECERLAEAVAAMMTKDRNLRPTFEEIARRLARIAARLDGELPRVTRQLFTVPPSSRQGSSSVEETPVPIPRNWSRIVFLAVVVAGAIGLGIVLGR